MPVELTKRERILRTMRREETDRVPLYDLLFCDGAIAHFSGEALPEPVATPENRLYAQRITGKAIANFLDMTRSSGFGPLVDRDYTDEYGFVLHEAAWEKTTWVKSRPFDDVPGAKRYLQWLIQKTDEETREIERDPTAHGEQYHRWWRENIDAYLGDTVHLITQQGTGLDEILYHLGFTLLAYVMADDPGLLSEALEAITTKNIAICHAIADPDVSPIVLTYCDVAYKDHLLYSPRFLRREIFPRIKRLNDAWHEHGTSCLYHSDGYLMDVLDDLVAIEIDGLNPIETVAGMSLKAVREKYPHLYLAGGIDMSQLLSNGTPEQVKQVCRDAVRDAYPGFFMGSTTEADNSCQAENLIAMYDVAMEGV
ncbi:MAG: uroporphyrinogen decarboxylase family protein [Anaerolineae bacterium]|nr:uroporphyrinogen decarboxylase family protein [Anaerolineae bacterium]